MRIWFDTEFWDTGCSIALLSIGMYREDGQTYYAEPAGAPLDQIRASTGENERWLVENVLPHLTGETTPRDQIAAKIVAFCGDEPEFWAYVAAYDWVALNQLYGPLVDRPKGWPIMCRDVKQLLLDAGDPWVPKQIGQEHNALDDAMWAHVAWTVAKGLDEFPPDLDHAIACVGRSRVRSVAVRFGYENGVRLPDAAWWRFVELAKTEQAPVSRAEAEAAVTAFRERHPNIAETWRAEELRGERDAAYRALALWRYLRCPECGETIGEAEEHKLECPYRAAVDAAEAFVKAEDLAR